MSRALTIVATMFALAVSAAPASAAVDAASTSPATPVGSVAVQPGTQGIIMRDGGICDPRHTGC